MVHASHQSIDIIQFGATGPVAERFGHDVAQRHMPFNLVGVVPAQDPQGAKTLPELYEKRQLPKPKHLANTPILSIEDALNHEAPLIFSSVSREVAAEYENPLALARLLIG
jgi:aspartate-semialdehyde dehydrogenase